MLFPLIRLPFLCIQCVLQQIAIIDLTDFSTISKRCHRIVKSLPRSLTGFDVRFSDNQLRIFFEKKEITCAKYVFDCGKTDFVGSISKNEVKTGLEKFFPETPWGDRYLLVKLILDDLKDLFKCPIRVLNFDMDTMKPRFLTLFNQCAVLVLQGKKPISNELLANILERITAKSGLWIHVPIYPSFEIDLSNIKADWIEFRHKTPRFISPSIAVQLNFETSEAGNSHWTSRDCISFVNQWFYSNNTKLQCVIMYFGAHTVHVNVNHLNPLPYCKKRRALLATNKMNEYCLSRIAKRNGIVREIAEEVDILRSDGLLATVSGQPEANHFIFRVWHDRCSGLIALSL